MKKQNFHEAFSQLLAQNLKKFQDGCVLDRATCLGIYSTLFETMQSIVINAEMKISNEALNYACQCYYDGLLINGREELDPNIFTERAKLDNVSNKDLVILFALLDGTDFQIAVVGVLKKRN